MRRHFDCQMQKNIFSAKFTELDDMREFCGDLARKAGFTEKEIYAIQLAVDEACTNIIEHAYGGEVDENVEVRCGFKDETLTIVLCDWGQPFDPASVPEPNLNDELSDRKIGGLGVYLMRKMMDSVSYETLPGPVNTLTLTKRKGNAG